MAVALTYWVAPPDAAQGAEVVQVEVRSLSPAAVRGNRIPVEVEANIAPGWHIHGHVPDEPFLIPTTLELSAPAGVRVGPVQYPEAEARSFAFAPNKLLRVYQGRVWFFTWVEVPTEFLGSEVRLEAQLRYQACTDTTCAAPAAARAWLLLPVADAGAAGISAAAGAPSTGVDFADWLQRRGRIATFFLVVLLGLGLNLTPCVYPLVSVTLAYFGRQARQNLGRLLLLAAVYAFGIVGSFATLGAAAALSGGLFGAWLQKPPVLVAAAILMVVLALGSFGLYQFRVPSSWTRRAGGAVPGILGALFMGLSMGIVAAPCVGPIVVGLLVFVGSQGNPWLGLELFTALGIGLALPYAVLAMLAGSLQALPRSGDWLVWVEHLFGGVLLVLAWYFVSPLVPKEFRASGYALLLAAGGLALGFLDPAGNSSARFRILKKAIGLSFVAVAAWLVVPAARSSLTWASFSEDALALARAQGRPVVIDFVADWCIPCHEMEATTFADPRVLELGRSFVLLRVDLTTENERTQKLTEQFGVRGVPTVIVLDAEGHEVARFVGYVGADELWAAMHKARAGTTTAEAARS